MGYQSNPNCADCGKNTISKENYTMNYYMVKYELWRKYGVKRGMICRSCFEIRLGRKLIKEDFLQCLLNKDFGNI